MMVLSLLKSSGRQIVWVVEQMMLSSLIHSHYPANVVMVIGTISLSQFVKMILVASDSVAPMTQRTVRVCHFTAMF